MKATVDLGSEAGIIEKSRRVVLHYGGANKSTGQGARKRQRYLKTHPEMADAIRRPSGKARDQATGHRPSSTRGSQHRRTCRPDWAQGKTAS